jgi:hypothetical protein
MPGDLDRGWMHRGTELPAAALRCCMSAQSCSRGCIAGRTAGGWMDRGGPVDWWSGLGVRIRVSAYIYFGANGPFLTWAFESP